MKLITIEKYVTVPDNIANGHAIRTLRQKKKVTLVKLAHRTGLSVAHLSRLELGGRTWTQCLINTIVRALRETN